jgi:hypothetical protein
MNEEKRMFNENSRANRLWISDMIHKKSNTIKKIQPLIIILSILMLSVITTTTVKGEESHSITFWESGVGDDFTGDVAIINGVGYGVSDLSSCYTVPTDRDVSFSYLSPLVVDSSKQYVWKYTTSDTNPPINTQTGTVPAGMDGNVWGFYETQYSVSFYTDPIGSGTTSPQGSNIMLGKGVIIISATSDSDYSFLRWISTGSITIADPSSATTYATIKGPGTITAKFEKDTIKYKIYPSVKGNGSIDPSYPVDVKEGGSRTFIFTPSSGYGVSAIHIDGVSVPVSASYTFSNVQDDHTIEVTFSDNAQTLVSVTIDSNPSGQGFVQIDGTPFATPQTFSWSPGSVHILEATSIVEGEAGVRFSFSSWSDGGSQTHSYTVRNSPESITASYGIQYLLTTKTNFGIVDVPDGTWYNAGSKVTLLATAPNVVMGESYVFSGWKGTLGGYAGGSNPSGEFTMNGPVTEEATWQHVYELKIISPYGSTSGSNWYHDGQVVHASVRQTKISDGSTTQHVFIGWRGDASGTDSTSNDILMDGPKTALAQWKTQYRVVFSQTGLDDRVRGEVLSVNGTSISFGDLPYVTEWMDSGDVINYMYNDVVTSSRIVETFQLSEVIGPQSPVIMEDGVTISGTYHSQWNVLLLMTPILASTILIAYFKRRNGHADARAPNI